jgi:hypothetical protein
MSGLSQMLRRVTGGRWPRPRTPGVREPHFGSWQKLGAAAAGAGFTSAPQTAESLSIERFRAAPAYYNRIDQLRRAFELAPAEGHILEFGVFRASTLNWLARWSQDRREGRVFGFDSFEGLPEAWVMTKEGGGKEQGHFAVEGLPQVLNNVELVPGFFDATLSGWLAEQRGPIALLHNDSDLYSSTIYTLTELNDRIVPGTIIVFDELCDWSQSGKYDNWVEGEWRALREWMAACDRQIEVLSRTHDYAAAVRVAQ